MPNDPFDQAAPTGLEFDLTATPHDLPDALLAEDPMQRTNQSTARRAI